MLSTAVVGTVGILVFGMGMVSVEVELDSRYEDAIVGIIVLKVG